MRVVYHRAQKGVKEEGLAQTNTSDCEPACTFMLQTPALQKA